jgi:DNA-3-methyladenine glycosylase I
MTTSDALAAGPDGRPRCFWAVDGAHEYLVYHDEEWGRPVLGDDGLFERLTLEAFQSGLSWLTILRKRPAFRAAFAGFDVAAVAAFGDADRDRLLADAGIVRNRLKIESAVKNARAFLALQEEFGSFDQYVWRFVGGRPIAVPRRTLKDVPARTAESDALSKDLKKRGMSFVGSTIMYAFLQATGLVNDHVRDCFLAPRASSRRNP